MKSYQVRTYGCQMNVHDSERLSGLLESAGYIDIAGIPNPPETADVVVFNTCAVRENADNKLYGNLGQLRPAKMKNPASSWPGEADRGCHTACCRRSPAQRRC